jgi:hypothetical protein
MDRSTDAREIRYGRAGAGVGVSRTNAERIRDPLEVTVGSRQRINPVAALSGLHDAPGVTWPGIVHKAMILFAVAGVAVALVVASSDARPTGTSTRSAQCRTAC